VLIKVVYSFLHFHDQREVKDALDGFIYCIVQPNVIMPVNKYPALRSEPSSDGSQAEGSDNLTLWVRMPFKSD